MEFNMEQVVKNLQDDFSQMRQDLTMIKDALIGTEYNEDGFVHRVKKLEGKAEETDKYIRSEKDRLIARDQREKRWALYAGMVGFLNTVISIVWSYNSHK